MKTNLLNYLHVFLKVEYSSVVEYLSYYIVKLLASNDYRIVPDANFH